MHTIGGATPKSLGGPNPSSTSSPLSLPFTFLSHAFPPLSFPSLSLDVGPLSTAKGIWASDVSSPNGVWGPAKIEFGAF